ncbi:hypothetical protein D9756_002380 [Leucocoprinus leucothites]|uniref:Protein kinase domain-containing protein n=1 Tax=Leucocoprinus leucothites TaxID=201217 RepID=A0A8H5GCC8_9AGAR|nr:hypothetical protein D9756_002380 [Leucoagaricus leucothites]
MSEPLRTLVPLIEAAKKMEETSRRVDPPRSHYGAGPLSRKNLGNRAHSPQLPQTLRIEDDENSSLNRGEEGSSITRPISVPRPVPITLTPSSSSELRDAEARSCDPLDEPDHASLRLPFVRQAGEENYQGISLDDSDTRSERSGWNDDPQMDKILGKLSDILRVQEKRNALSSLQGDHAQLFIDFLYFLVSDPRQLPGAWLRKHALLALRKLSESSLLYPQCRVLKDIQYDPSAPAACGGFCDIFKARYNKEDVCLKVVRLYQNSDATKVLRVCTREAVLWGQLRHPNIVPFYGVYYLSDFHRRICLVSPWMDDGNISTYLQENPQAPRKPLIYDIILGLEYLHDENIIHGDLKGMNILVNGSGQACITDFGLSSIWTDKTLGFTATTVVQSGRTDRWASPELITEDGARPTRASDIWAFGCVCYEILTRLLPFRECTMNVQVLRKLLEGKLPALQDDRGINGSLDKVDQEMWTLMVQCWLAEPEQRPTCQRVLIVFHTSYKIYQPSTQY